MDTSTTGLAESCLGFDLNDDIREKEFEGGAEIHVDGNNKSSSLGKEERDLLIDKLNQMKSEKKKLIEMLIISFASYSTLQSHLSQLVQNYSGEELNNSRKRKFEVENSINTMGNDTVSYDGCISDQEGSPKRPREIRTNISRVYVKVDPSDTSLIVKDGYHWRKYGQKVTKDNPSPRAYYKCSYAPSCQVKKKVQKSVGDPCLLIATYEGEHNHEHPLKTEMFISSAQGAAAATFTPSSNFSEYPSSKERVDFLDRGSIGSSFLKSISTAASATGTNAIQQLMVEHMASTLTRNPSFTAAVAAAISDRIINFDSDEN